MKILIIVVILWLSSCASNTTASRRVHEKQRTPSDIKISHLDLNKKILNLRFNYRTYIEKTLHHMNCEITFNQDIFFKLNKSYNLTLGAFSTEVLNFELSNGVNLNRLIDSKSINYSLECKVDYNKGKESIYYDSVLHLVPASQSQYR